jgi:20S proteasome alpha/beta subunit
MTLAMALRAMDGLVLATDSRVTGPQGTADTSEKFLQVNRDIGALTYGLAGPGYLGISRLVNAVAAEKLATFSRIDERAARIFQETCEEWRSDRPEARAPQLVGYVVAGYDSVETKQFQIRHYETVLGESPISLAVKRLEGDLLAGQWRIARYLLSKLHYGDMTTKELAGLAVLILAQTMMVEMTVGGPMQLASVTISEGFQRIYEKEVMDMVRENQCRSRRLDLELRTAFLAMLTAGR